MVAVCIVIEDSSPIDTAADDVVNGSGCVYACLSRHADKLATGNPPGNTCLPLPFFQS